MTEMRSPQWIMENYRDGDDHDGRLWDGHHRMRVAVSLGLDVPVAHVEAIQ